jgi:tetratricopeptide (TPR) repeat protein
MKIFLTLGTIFIFTVSLAAQSTAADYLQAGKDFYSNGNYQSAIKQFTAGLKLEPRNLELLGLRAESYLQKGNLALSLVDCNKAMAIDSRFGKAYKIRGAIASKQNKFTAAVQDFQKAQEYHYQFTSGDCYEVGFAYQALKQYDRAIEAYANTIRLNEIKLVGALRIAYRSESEVYRAFSQLGILYDETGNSSDSDLFLHRAIKLNPKNPEAYNLRGGIAYRKTNYQQAGDDYTHVVQLQPKNAQAWMRLGKSQHIIGYHDDAIKCSLEALKLNPKLNEARFNLGLIQAYQGGGEKSQITYQEALKFSTPNEVQAALQDLQIALTKQPESPALLAAQKILQAPISKPDLIQK